MTYGPHSQLVEEVFEFAKCGNLLAPCESVEQDAVVLDFEEATRRAWEATTGKTELTWPNIREDQMGLVWEVVYQIQDFSDIDQAMTEQLDLLSKVVQRRLKPEYEELIDDIMADFHGCAYSRTAQGTQNSFFERVFEIYKLGGWPCGWKGNYPNGQIVVFLPPSK